MSGQPVRRLNPVALQCEIADLLIEQNRLLGDIRDRLPEPTVAGRPGPEPQPVEVREPAPKLAPGRRAVPESQPEVVPVSEPATKSPVQKSAPRKTAARRRT